MNLSSKHPFSAVAALLVFVALLAGCDRGRTTGLRDWSASDHDPVQGPNGANGAVSPPPPVPADSNAAGSKTEEAFRIAELTWGKQCVLCHGPEGHGDGPQGPMLHAPDLSRADWQQKVSDQEIAATIANGRGSMPKFAFSPDVTAALVGKIRRFTLH